VQHRGAAVTDGGGSMSFLTSREQVAPRGIGKPVRRREDARLLTGAGRFADDVSLPRPRAAAKSSR